MTIRIAATVAASLLPIVAFAQTTTPDFVKGHLTVGGQAFPFTHVYAKRVNDVEGDRLAGPQKSLLLLFSDAALTPDEIDDWFHLADRARTLTFHAVELRYDPAANALFGATIFYAEKASDPPNNISLSGQDTNLRLDGLKIEQGMMSGTARMEKPDNWLQFGDDRPKEVFSYRAEFRTAIQDAPPITADLHGAAAKSSPQAAAAVAFFIALRAGDIDAVRRLALSDTKMEAYIKAQGADNARKLMQQMSPDPKLFADNITRVIVRGDRCSLISASGAGKTGDMRIRLVRTSGKWLVVQ